MAELHGMQLIPPFTAHTNPWYPVGSRCLLFQYSSRYTREAWVWKRESSKFQVISLPFEPTLDLSPKSIACWWSLHSLWKYPLRSLWSSSCWNMDWRASGKHSRPCSWIQWALWIPSCNCSLFKEQGCTSHFSAFVLYRSIPSPRYNKHNLASS